MKMPWRAWAMALLAALPCHLAAAPNSFTKPYLLSLDSCKQNGLLGCTLQGAGAETIFVLQSDDGRAWSPVPGFTPFEGGVPAIVRRGNTIYLYYMPTGGPPPRYEVRRYRMDTGTWDAPAAVVIDDPLYPTSANSPAAILDPQGNLALLSDTGLLCETHPPCDTIHQRIAREVAGSDGTRFSAMVDDVVTTPFFQPVVSGSGLGAGDATIFFDGARYVIQLPTQRQVNPIHGTRILTSTDVYGPYTVSSVVLGAASSTTSGVGFGAAVSFYNRAYREYWHYVVLPAPSLYRVSMPDLDHDIDVGGFIPANAVLSSAALGVDPTENIEHPHFLANWSGAQTISATTSPTVLSAATGKAATATVMLTNGDSVAAGDCFVAPRASFAGSFTYRATSPVSAPPDTPVSVPGNGGAQAFSIAFTTTEPFAATEMALEIGCGSSTTAPVITGTNTITISSAGAPIRDYEGLWWKSPAGSESGWGVNLTHQGDVANRADVLFATWFTYDTDGSGMWLVMSDGARTGDASYSGTLYRTTGPAFNLIPFNSSRVGLSPVGSATFTFSDADNGTFQYSVNGVAQSKAITRQVYATPVPKCSVGGSPGTTPIFQDLWWNAPAGSESGWGINLTQQGDILFATWFTYGADGKGMWLVMSNGTRTTPFNWTYSGPLYRTTGPAFSAVPWDPAQVKLASVGTATFEFANATSGLFSYTVDGISGAKSITRQLYSNPASVCR